MIDEDDPTSTFMFNIEFRRTFFHLCGNTRLADFIDEFMGHIFFLGIITLKKKSVREIVVSGQHMLVEGLKKGDEQHMEALLMDYLDSAYESIMEEIK